MPEKTTEIAEETTAAPDFVPSDNLEDIRARIRRRAEELNLEANDKPAAEVFDKADPKGFLQDALDTAVERAEIEAQAEETSGEWDDGLSLVEGAVKELGNIQWPTIQETAVNTVWVVGITIFMIGFTFFIDNTSKFILKDTLLSVGVDVSQPNNPKAAAPKQLEGTPLVEEGQPQQQACLFNPGGCKKE